MLVVRAGTPDLTPGGVLDDSAVVAKFLAHVVNFKDGFSPFHYRPVVRVTLRVPPVQSGRPDGSDGPLAPDDSVRCLNSKLAGLLLGSLLASALPGGGVQAAPAADPVELAFWEAAQSSGNPRELQHYLSAYPNGVFAPLARLRLQSQEPPPRPPTEPAFSAPRPQSFTAQAWVRPTAASVELVDGVTLDLDAQALRDSSNLRLVVVPADLPDAVGDVQAFAEDSTPITATRLRLTVPAGPPGHDEVRLYHLAPYSTAYAVGARAPVMVKPGVPGAALARDLTREAARLGPVRFEANHRDRPILVQAAFLRVRPQTEWNLQWFGLGAYEMPKQVVVVSLGMPGAAPNFYGSPGEVVCVLSAQRQEVLDRIARLQLGDPVLVQGVPSSWSSASAGDPVVLRSCALAR